MSISYTYKIISVDSAARCMEIIYSSEGRQTMHISARLPFEGESLESVVEMYSPVAYWIEQETPVFTPEIGTTGTVSPTQVESLSDNPFSSNDIIIDPVIL